MHCSLLDRLGFSENGQHFDRGLPISRITVEGHTDGRYVSATPKDLISDISRYVIDFRKTLVVQEIFLKIEILCTCYYVNRWWRNFWYSRYWRKGSWLYYRCCPVVGFLCLSFRRLPHIRDHRHVDD